jgi:hypothetical protein
MGANVSSNISESVARVTTTVLNSYINSCGVAINSQQEWNAVGCNGVTIKDNDYSNIVVYDAQCLQSINNNEQVINSVAQAIQQLAQSESQNIGWPSANVANNYSSTVAQMATSVTQQFMNQCAGSITSSSSLNCVDSSNIVFEGNSFSNTLNDAATCTQNILSQIGITNNISQSVSQTASAKEQNSLFVIFLLLLIPLIFAFIFLTTNGKWIIIMLIVLLIVGLIIYLVLAKEEGWKPFAQ